MNRRKRRTGVRQILGTAVILAGAAVFLYPDISSLITRMQDTAVIEEWKEENESQGIIEEQTEESTDEEETEETKERNEEDMTLLKNIQEYNESIYQDGQQDFSDAWTVTQMPVSIEGLYSDLFGFIEIPAMDVSLPLYIGASEENMAKGAAVLGATSIPVGGINTNSVIAGHRGYRNGRFFLDIEDLEIGDMVYVTNQWETLSYRVDEIKIIDPWDDDAVKIQEGRDLITLITCHPYRSGGKYRYCVFCERDDSGEISEPEETADIPDITVETTSDLSEDEETSEADIHRERLFRRGCAGLILGLCLFVVWKNRKKKD